MTSNQGIPDVPASVAKANGAEAMGAAIRERAGRLNFKQKDLAAAAGMKTSTVGNYWNGVREPGFTALVQLADALQIDAGELVSRAAELLREAEGRSPRA